MGKAVLYARVSTDDQAADDKTSLSEQLLALRRYAEANDYEVLDEIPEDITGRKRHTPGMDQIRDMAEAGEIDAVLVYKWNRLARTVARYEMFIAEMKMAGVDVIALDGQSNKTAHGRMFNRMMAVFSEYQRDDLIATMQQGKIGRARSGRVVPTKYPPYGFEYDKDSGAYVVDDPRMDVVRRIFRMVGAEGKPLNRVKTAFDREGVPTAGELHARRMGRPVTEKKAWRQNVIRRMVLNDVYLARGYDEIAALVEPQVAAQLDPEKRYGIQWYNRARYEKDFDNDSTPQNKVTHRDRSDWIAVPVPDPGIQPEWVLAAREAVQNNVKPSNAGRRRWELQGFVYCPCGRRLIPNTSTNSKNGKTYRYYQYVCPKRRKNAPDACEHARYWKAEALEDEVRRAVVHLLRDPDVFREKVQERIRAEQGNYNPDREAAAWYERIATIERKREGYWDLAAGGDMPRDVMRAKVADLDSQLAECKRELAGIQDRQQRIDELEELEAIISDRPGQYWIWINWPDQDESDPWGYRKLLSLLGWKITKHETGKLEIEGDAIPAGIRQAEPAS